MHDSASVDCLRNLAPRSIACSAQRKAKDGASSIRSDPFGSRSVTLRSHPPRTSICGRSSRWRFGLRTRLQMMEDQHGAAAATTVAHRMTWHRCLLDRCAALDSDWRCGPRHRRRSEWGAIRCDAITAQRLRCDHTDRQTDRRRRSDPTAAVEESRVAPSPYPATTCSHSLHTPQTIHHHRTKSDCECQIKWWKKMTNKKSTPSCLRPRNLAALSWQIFKSDCHDQ